MRAIPRATITLAVLLSALVCSCHRPDPATRRRIEARLGWLPLDGHLPYRPSLPEPPPRRALAALEERGDLHGVAATCLAYRDLPCAVRFLARASNDVGVQIDRAVLALGEGRPEDALRALDEAASAPAGVARAGTVEWNRALVLADLGLPLAAAEAFDSVAARGEPGWAEEARSRAQVLRRSHDEHERAWQATAAAGWALARTGTLPPPELVAAQPIALRYWLNHAIRAAGTRTEALALAPLAEQLDAATGAHVLAEEVRRVAAADFVRRAPLAGAYRALLSEAGPRTPEAAGRFLEDARAAGQNDLWVGALPILGRMREELGEFLVAARALGDPWYEALASEEAARAAIARGDLVDGERRLFAALSACRAARVDYRCVPIAADLAELLHDLHRISEAAGVARQGLQMARRHAPPFETSLIFQLADIARYRSAFSLMRAFLREGELRAGDDCVSRRYVHELRATERSFALDPERARAELALAPRCDQPITQVRADLLADLERMGAPLPEAKTLLDDLAAARPLQSASERAQADVFAGRYLAVRDPQAGAARLRLALAAADPRSDSEARKARTMALLSLSMEAARAGSFALALAHLGRWSDSAPGRCVVGVAVDAERAFAAARGADGAVVGRFVGHRSSPELDVQALVPAEIVGAVRGCATVEVLALPPVHGLSRLLPRELAWSYHTGVRSKRSSPPPLRLIVSGVDAPARLGLPRLAPWTPRPAPDQIWLTGAEATPARTLAALQPATEAVFHVHGLADLGVSDVSMLVLSPGSDGEWALTAGRVQQARLTGQPVIILAACDAAETAPWLHEPWGLPLAFIRAGARAVVASPASLPDAESARLFDALLTRMRGGESPAESLRDERVARNAAWSDELLLFE